MSYTIKNLDMNSILKHRQGHHVSFKKGLKAETIEVDDISLRSSHDSSSKVSAVGDHKSQAETEMDLASDGASTFRDFVPREVQQLEK